MRLITQLANFKFVKKKKRKKIIQSWFLSASKIHSFSRFELTSNSQNLQTNSNLILK